MFKVGWIGYGGHALYAEALRPTIEKLGMELVTIHEWDNANIKWQLGTWLDEMKKLDFIICPTDPEKFPAKSQNKLTQAMSLGKPVVCSPLDAYKAIEAKYPGCCLFASTPEEWEQQLTRLKDDQVLRDSLIQKGRAACSDFHPDKIGQRWIDLLKGVIAKTDIVIPTYNNLRGLKLCLDSIRQCTPEAHNVIVVQNGENPEMQKYLEQQADITYIKKDRMTFAKAVNIGIKAGESKYVCLLNDDVIVSNNWLGNLISACEPGVGAVGPLSNCDKGWLHNYDLYISGVPLLPGTNTFDQIELIVKDIYSYESVYTEAPERDWVAFYCTLIPRTVIEAVGILNELYINSGEDVDYCNRVRKLGYKIRQNYKSFVFHFGAVSRKGQESEDKETYQNNDRLTQSILRKIWDRKSVVIYSGPSYERWDFRNVDTGGIGGSETWQVMLARELNKLGYRVTCFCDCSESGIKEGDVEYFHFTDYNAYIDQNWIDYFISSRTTDTLRFPVRAGKTFVMCHDIWLLSDRYQMFPEKVTKYCVLSDWHKTFFKDHHGAAEEKMLLTSNGIDFERFDSVPVERNPYRFHYSSSWDRGLDNILYLWPFIRAQIPEAELHVFYGCQTWKASCIQKNDQAGLKKIAEIEEGMKLPGVFNHGRVGQKELAVEVKKSSLLLYPQWFSETFFIGGVECQYAGVPVLCSRYAGVTTTFMHPQLGDTAIMLGNGDAWWPYSKEGREAFLAETVSILKDKTRWQEWSDRGRENAKRFSWANVALMWDAEFKK